MTKHHMSIDIETFSSEPIGDTGLYKYVQSPDFDILLFAYSIDGGPVYILDLTQTPEQGLPNTIRELLSDPAYIKHAYNASFEWYCLSEFIGQALPLEQWRCTMLHGLYCGYTAGLDATGKALGLPQDKQKLATGKALIRTFCVPCKPTKTNGGRTRTLPHHEPEKWELFKKYCKQDVVTEMAIEDRLSGFPVPDFVQEQWERNERQNAFGVKADRSLVEGAIAIDALASEELQTEARRLTGLDNPKSVAQLLPWLNEKLGKELPNLQKATVQELLNNELPDDVRRVLQLRLQTSKTSVKKYQAMKTCMCEDDRIRGLMQFYGANRTGRWAGRLVQVQNLTKNRTELLDFARDCVKQQKADVVKVVFGDIPDILSQLVRTAFIAKEGCRIISADFSAIEARVIAWLAGEKWRLDTFAKGGDIYCASASQMFGVPVEKHGVNGHLRQKGKVAELALGYQGGTGALITMGALDMGLEEAELPEIVNKWRSASPNIVKLWYAFQSAAMEVIEGKGDRSIPVKGTNAAVTFRREFDVRHGQDFLTIQLPSGRKLFYVKPFIGENRFGSESICYYGINQTTKKWEKQETYGGKLVENTVQAIARDCLAEALRRIEDSGYHTVFTVHDEAIIEAPDRDGTLEDICAIMGSPVPWAPGLSLPADGFVSDYYMKD